MVWAPHFEAVCKKMLALSLSDKILSFFSLFIKGHPLSRLILSQGKLLCLCDVRLKGDGNCELTLASLLVVDCDPVLLLQLTPSFLLPTGRIYI